MTHTRSARATNTRPEQANQPGLGTLRAAVASAKRGLPSTSTIRRDGLAGLTVAISNVPDGMAAGVLVGVNPLHGLYAGMVGPIVGAVVSSTVLMVVATTGAASLVTGQALNELPGADREAALFLMVVLAGVFQVVLGLLRLGRLTRFVSYSVMTGFLTGISVILVLGQLPTAAGYDVEGGNRIAQTLDLFRNIGSVSVTSLIVSGITILLALVLPRTPLTKFTSLIAVAVPTLLVAVTGMEGIEIVADVGDIPRSLPMPDAPSLKNMLDIATGALSLAAIILVQGAGVSQSVPNPDGSKQNPSRDFIAQGAANIASGVFRGLPVGASLGSTALNVTGGATRRWAAIFAGLWMLLIVVAAPGAVSRVAMPSLAALLVIAGIRSVKPSEIAMVWHAGWGARAAAAVTFAGTLFLSIQAAVALGIVLSAIVYINGSSTDISLVELVERKDGLVEERRPPRTLEAGSVTVLDVYGHLFFAGARTFADMLPDPADARDAIVILRMRGQHHVGATLVKVLTTYADTLHANGGQLYLTGVSDEAHARFEANERFSRDEWVRIYDATRVIGESTRRALADADAWRIAHNEVTRDGDEGMPPRG